MESLKILVVAIGLIGFFYSFYCQIQARKHISNEKIKELDDPAKYFNSEMPYKEILSDEGLKYDKGFKIGMFIFFVSIVISMFI